MAPFWLCLIQQCANAFTNVARKWQRTREGVRHGVGDVHRVPVAFQNKIHFKAACLEVQQLGSNTRDAPRPVLFAMHAVQQDSGLGNQPSP